MQAVFKAVVFAVDSFLRIFDEFGVGRIERVLTTALTVRLRIFVGKRAFDANIGLHAHLYADGFGGGGRERLIMYVHFETARSRVFAS